MICMVIIINFLKFVPKLYINENSHFAFNIGSFWAQNGHYSTKNDANGQFVLIFV